MGMDYHNCISIRSRVDSTEIVENEAPVFRNEGVYEKGWGIGKYRGGLGPKIVIKCIENKEMKISAML